MELWRWESAGSDNQAYYCIQLLVRLPRCQQFLQCNADCEGLGWHNGYDRPEAYSHNRSAIHVSTDEPKGWPVGDLPEFHRSRILHCGKQLQFQLESW